MNQTFSILKEKSTENWLKEENSIGRELEINQIFGDYYIVTIYLGIIFQSFRNYKIKAQLKIIFRVGGSRKVKSCNHQISQKFLTLAKSKECGFVVIQRLKNGIEETSTTHKVVKIPDTPGCGDID